MSGLCQELNKREFGNYATFTNLQNIPSVPMWMFCTFIGSYSPFAHSFYIHSEYEACKGYPDIFLERMPGRPMKYDIVLELKYVKKSKENTLPAVISEAETQLDAYMKSERFARPDVRGYYVIFFGGEVYRWREWKAS